MVTDTTTSLVDATTQWLKREASAKGFGSQFEAYFIRRDGEWYHFAVKMDAQEMPIFRIAEKLRELEDAWDKDHPGSRLLLVPSAG
jgi:hypothetical protein